MTSLVMFRLQRWFPSARTCSSPQPTERPAGPRRFLALSTVSFESPQARNGNSAPFLNSFVPTEPINGSVDACTPN